MTRRDTITSEAMFLEITGLKNGRTTGTDDTT